MIIAIDGPAGSGKSAVGKRVAVQLGLRFVDSGLMYRAIACLAQDRGLELRAGAELARLAHQVEIELKGSQVWAGGVDLTTRVYAPELSEAASKVGKIAGVRLALVAQLRRLGRGGVVMAGRDVGTVIFPDTSHKFFLTASIEERVRRRMLQITERGEPADPTELAREVRERDRRDSERSVSPMRMAEDASRIETDHLSVEEVAAEVLRQIAND
ncbi:MAG: (d)CMP kinase [Candidatus Dormibacteraceae bacterium]